jgi:hypothetical protein
MKKVTKSQVISKLKKLNEGESLTVSLFPSNCGPANTVWVQGYEKELTKDDLNLLYGHIKPEVLEKHVTDVEKSLTKLDSLVNDFQYYNCNNELGMRVHFYINE